MIEIAETSENACNQTLTIAVSRDECLPLMKVLARRHSNSSFRTFTMYTHREVSVDHDHGFQEANRGQCFDIIFNESPSRPIAASNNAFFR